jgi:predicted metal-dependent peptidase
MSNIKDNKIFNTILKIKINDFNFFYEFLLGCNIYESDKIPTAGIKATMQGFEILYNKKHIDSLDEKELTYLFMHECMHPLSDHMKRAQRINVSKSLSNQVQDCIIDNNILKYFSCKSIKPYAVIPVPAEYTGKWIFEEMYYWIRDNKEYNDKFINASCKDEHLEDEVSDQLKSAMVESFIDKQKAKGNMTGDIESMLGGLRPKKNNWMSEMKRSFSQLIGKFKQSSWKRLSRRINDEDDFILKGFKKQKFTINIGCDTSGSMSGSHQKIISWVASNDIDCNFIQCDTEVKEVSKIKNIKQFEKVKLKGFGGTELTPIFDLITKKYNNNCTVLLTDGECNSVDICGIKKDILVFTTHEKVNFINNNHIRIKQVIIPKDEEK